MSVAEPAASGLETAAIERLYERHSSRVFGYCLRMLGSREEAEDASQTTFMQAYRALQRGVVPTFETAWLLTIARNVCFARHRAGKRRSAVEFIRDPQDLEELAAGPEPLNGVLMGLQAALARLPEMQRRAFLLREWQGRSYAEIGEELGVTVPAVEALIFRARRALARDLGGEKRRGHAFDFASLLAGAAKSLLGAGTAAKVAVGAATVVSAGAVVGGAVQMQRPDEPAPRPAQPVQEIRTSDSVSQNAPAKPATRSAGRGPATATREPERRSRTGAPRKTTPGAATDSPGSPGSGAPSASAPETTAPTAPAATAPQPAPPAAAPAPVPTPQLPAAPAPPVGSTAPPPPLQLPAVEEVTEQLPVQLPELPDTSELPVVGPIVDEVPIVDDVLDGLPLGLGG